MSVSRSVVCVPFHNTSPVHGGGYNFRPARTGDDLRAKLAAFQPVPLLRPFRPPHLARPPTGCLSQAPTPLPAHTLPRAHGSTRPRPWYAAAAKRAVEGEAMELNTQSENVHVRPERHALPPLPYEYDALEPYIDERTMRLHHDVHHRAYVDALNRAEAALSRARRHRDWTALNYWQRQLAFNGSAHFLHSIFWSNMHPNGGGRPTDEGLMKQIERDFGSFDAFRAHFTEAANALDGSGWVLLVWQPMAEKLEILQTEQHHCPAQWTAIPVLVLDCGNTRITCNTAPGDPTTSSLGGT